MPATSPVTKMTRFARPGAAGGQRPVERLSIEPRHLQIADDGIEGLRLDLGQRLFAVRRVFDEVAGVAKGVGHRAGQRRFVLDDEHGCARHRVDRLGTLTGAGGSLPPLTGSST